MTREIRRQLIDRYKDGCRAVADALAGATGSELDRRPAPGTWSAREIVHHLADSEMTAGVRLRLLLAEDQPIIRATIRRSSHAGCVTTVPLRRRSRPSAPRVPPRRHCSI